MSTTRIPKLAGTTRAAAASWTNRMHKKGLLFCLDDDPADIVSIVDGKPAFLPVEIDQLKDIIGRLYTSLGDEIHQLAFEALSKTFHTRSERAAFRTMFD